MNNCLFVANIDLDAREDDLRDTFEPFGRITSIQLSIDPSTGGSCGFGFVEYKSNTAATSAMQSLDGVPILGRSVHVSIAYDRSPTVDEPREYQ